MAFIQLTDAEGRLIGVKAESVIAVWPSDTSEKCKSTVFYQCGNSPSGLSCQEETKTVLELLEKALS